MLQPQPGHRLKLLTSVALGALAIAGYAPFYLFPATVAGLAGLFYLWHKADSAQAAAWLGFSFGLGFFLTGVSWIYVSLHDFGGMPWWMAGLATFLFCAFLALFPALVGYTGKKLALSSNAGIGVLAAPLLWVLSEWVRSWIFTGFPWLSVGYAQVPYSPLAGYAPLLGVFGVSLVTAISASLLSLGYKAHMRRHIVLGLLLLWSAGGAFKLIVWSKPVGEPVSVALVQGNIAQDMKWLPEETQRTLENYLALSLDSKARLIVLPETAFPLLLHQIPKDYLALLTEHAQQNHGDILFGTVELENGQYYNSMLSTGTAPAQTYRKSHLVPFGEFIPLKGVFGWIYRDWLNIPLTDLGRGSIDQQPLKIAGQRVAVNICYEDVFGEEIIRQLPQASILVNTSNDAWYGESLAAYQHLQISQTRALETGRMMLRATNTGATAIIDRQGQVLAHAPHFSASVLEGEAQGYSGSTPYVKFGNGPVILFCLLLLVVLLARGGLNLLSTYKKK